MNRIVEKKTGMRYIALVNSDDMKISDADSPQEEAYNLSCRKNAEKDTKNPGMIEIKQENDSDEGEGWFSLPILADDHTKQVRIQGVQVACPPPYLQKNILN
jgi:hypothetical protein